MIYYATILQIFMTTICFASQPIRVPAPIEKTFSIKNGFDNNDNIEVFISGYLPNTCYQLGDIEVTKDHEKKSIQIHAYAYLHQDRSCLQVRTPYLETVNLGILPSGTYQIDVAGSQDFSHQMIVTKSLHPQQDNSLYAPVQSVSLDSDREYAHITGQYPHVLDGCMMIDRVETYQTQDVLVILPIATIVRDEVFCAQQDSFFDLAVEIDRDIKEKNGLVYVRTASGRSKSIILHD